jgi:hypothetical protein
VSANATSPKIPPPASSWRLWIDGCGGFLLLSGDSWSVGGVSHETRADVCVRADWPRHAGTIHRDGGDYFWKEARSAAKHQLLASGQPLPISGSATVSLHQPSSLCDSAILTLSRPHRFDQHVDGVILVNETLLVGPSPDCHIRFRESTDRAVITRREDRWLAKIGLAGDFKELRPGQRTMLRTLAITLEKA